MAGYTVRGRGKLIVAVLVVLAVVGSIVWFVNQSDGGRPGPQGKFAPDSNEGVYGMGSPETKRSTPELNPGRGADVANTASPDTGRNAPRDPGATPQDAPTGSLTDSPNADPERSREPARQ